jgi:hypothetical protein
VDENKEARFRGEHGKTKTCRNNMRNDFLLSLGILLRWTKFSKLGERPYPTQI